MDFVNLYHWDNKNLHYYILLLLLKVYDIFQKNLYSYLHFSSLSDPKRIFFLIGPRLGHSGFDDKVFSI